MEVNRQVMSVLLSEITQFDFVCLWIAYLRDNASALLKIFATV